MKPSINLSELIEAIKTDLVITAPVVVKRVPPCETRHNDGRCVKERRGYTVLLNEYIHDDAKLIHLLAHEMRHVWQYETGFGMTLEDNFASQEVYISAPEEIDANIYGARIAARYSGYVVCTWR